MTRSLSLAGLLALLAIFIAVTWAGTGEHGLVAEEVQPTLARYPRVLEWRAPGQLDLMPPYETGAPSGPRWVATSQWPVLGYDGATRLWPVFIRGHQSALASYVGLALGPWLGGGVTGVQRATVLLAAALVLLSVLLARRLALGWPAALLAGAVVASSFGLLWIARTGYAFEVASRVAMLVALALAAPRTPLSARRAVLVGLAVGVAVLSRATVAVTLAPALAVLLAHPSRQPGRRALLALGLSPVALPFAVHLAVWCVAPFREGTAPLAGFPVGDLLARAVGAPHQLALQLAWLGDATAVLGPTYLGARELPSLGWAALAGAAVLALAAWRWRRGSASDAELMLLAATATGVVAGALFYPAPKDFQLALGLEPLFGLALAAQVAAVPGRTWRAVAVALVLAVRGRAAVAGLGLDAQVGNPMLSARAQRAAVARLDALGLTGAEVVTVAYNQAGVVEAWTDGRIRPLHAWPLFMDADPGRSDAGWRELLARFGPRYVLLTEGGNLFEGGKSDPAAIAASLGRVAAERGQTLVRDAEFPTESGGPGWALVRLDP